MRDCIEGICEWRSLLTHLGDKTSDMADLIGYARVSKSDGSQDPALQLDALKKAGCAKVFTDKASGAIQHRPELDRLLEHLRPGDTLVVWRLDRLARSLRHLLLLVDDLGARGVAFMSLTEAIDTSTPSGKFTYHLFGALAELELSINRTRTRAGLDAARARGRVGGRPPSLSVDQVKLARQLIEGGKHTVGQIAGMFSVSRKTIYRSLRREESSCVS